MVVPIDSEPELTPGTEDLSFLEEGLVQKACCLFLFSSIILRYFAELNSS